MDGEERSNKRRRTVKEFVLALKCKSWWRREHYATCGITDDEYERTVFGERGGGASIVERC